MNEYRNYTNKKKSEREIETLARNEIRHPNSRRSRTCFRSQAKLTQEELEKKICEFIIHAMIPLKIVDDPYFIDIFHRLNIAHDGLRLISRRSLARRIDTLYADTKEKLKSLINHIPYVCTTTDIWSGKTRSFLGVTIHWIDNNCNRKSATLACRRFPNKHSAENIAELLSKINTEYNIDYNKICATITDNASNFVKAFKEYSIQNYCIENSEDDSVNVDIEISNDIFSCTESDEDTEMTQQSHILMTSINTIEAIRLPYLPKHLRCCAHILNLIASADLLKAINASNLLHMHKKIMSKCNILWKATTRPKSAEIMQQLLGLTLPRPGDTRWNSLYVALQKIVDIKLKCPLLFQALQNRTMILDDEFKYIEEHLKCTKPVADALDMQGEKFAYYGIVVPTLISLKRKLEHLNTREFQYCKPVAQSLLENINRRFAHFFDFSSEESINAAIAALAHPEFKNRWLSCVAPGNHNKLLTAFKDSVSAEIQCKSTNENDIVDTSENNFFDFGEENAENSSSTLEPEVQIANFFNDRTNNLQTLNNYQAIKAVFIKFNTPLPSSAAVERLFSYATMTNLPKSNRLSDKKFEQRIFLRGNLHLFS